ncbi:MAG: hypothetical protein ABJA69_12790, partial [Acidobacteriaceae bacterium]
MRRRRSGSASDTIGQLESLVKRQYAESERSCVYCRMPRFAASVFRRYNRMPASRQPHTVQESAMGESFSGKPSLKPQEDRLDSWKEIATYLKRDVTTVQRWEKREGMPVQRHLHGRMGSVYAYRSELDAWVRSRNTR